MKITNICLAGPVTDGWNYQDNMLPKYQTKNGADVTIITSHWIWGEDGKLHRDDREEYINKDGVRVIRLEMQGKDDFNKKFKVYPSLYSVICQTNPDILFIHGVSFVDTTVIARYLREHSVVKAFADNHADFSNSATNWFSRIFLHKIIWKHFAWKLLPYVDTFFGVLPSRVDFLTDVYGMPKEKCELLVMGADDELIEKSNAQKEVKKLREKFGVKNSDFLIVTGGKIDKAKIQTELLIKAVKKLERQDVKLLFFGSIEEEIKERILSFVDNKRVIYAGWVTPDESYDYFAIADLVIFPGRHSVFWEQVVAQGIPMVVKDWPGTHHVDVGGNVLFIKEDSVSEISKIILGILDEPERYEKMKEIAMGKGKETFSYKEIAKRSVKLS